MTYSDEPLERGSARRSRGQATGMTEQLGGPTRRWALVSGDRTRRRTCLVQAALPRERNTQAPDMRTGQSAQACLRREVSTDHEARSHTQRGPLRERVTIVLES